VKLDRRWAPRPAFGACCEDLLEDPSCSDRAQTPWIGRWAIQARTG